jgi:hypothetical protein
MMGKPETETRDRRERLIGGGSQNRKSRRCGRKGWGFPAARMESARSPFCRD